MVSTAFLSPNANPFNNSFSLFSWLILQVLILLFINSNPKKTKKNNFQQQDRGVLENNLRLLGRAVIIDNQALYHVIIVLINGLNRLFIPQRQSFQQFFFFSLRAQSASFNTII